MVSDFTTKKRGIRQLQIERKDGMGFNDAVVVFCIIESHPSLPREGQLSNSCLFSSRIRANEQGSCLICYQLLSSPRFVLMSGLLLVLQNL